MISNHKIKEYKKVENLGKEEEQIGIFQNKGIIHLSLKNILKDNKCKLEDLKMHQGHRLKGE